MPEMTDVATGESVASAWGNNIRDRTIQRYATTAERTSLHSSPTAGDLAFMEDTGLVFVYYDGAWTPLAEQVDGLSESSGASALTTAYATYETVNLTIPAYWNTWKCAAWASAWINTDSPPIHDIGIRIRIAGTDKQPIDGPGQGFEGPNSIVAMSTGLSATGAVTVLLRAIGDPIDTISDRTLYALATRLT